VASWTSPSKVLTRRDEGRLEGTCGQSRHLSHPSASPGTSPPHKDMRLYPPEPHSTNLQTELHTQHGGLGVALNALHPQAPAVLLEGGDQIVLYS